MAVLRIEIEIVGALKLVSRQRSVSKMDPWFTEEDECRVILLHQFIETKFVPEQAFTVPSENFCNKRTIWSCISIGN